MACPWSGANCGCGKTFVPDWNDPRKLMPWFADQNGLMPERCESHLSPALRELHKHHVRRQVTATGSTR